MTKWNELYPGNSSLRAVNNRRRPAMPRFKRWLTQFLPRYDRLARYDLTPQHLYGVVVPLPNQPDDITFYEYGHAD